MRCIPSTRPQHLLNWSGNRGDQSRVSRPTSILTLPIVGFVVCASAAQGFAQSADRVQLGVFAPGSTLQIPLDSIVPATRLEVVIDGEIITSPFGVSGSTLSLAVPRTLSGVVHDIVVYETGPAGRTRIGTWEFETVEGAWDYFASVHIESGLRASGNERESYTRGGGRLDFDLDDGRSRGGLSFTLRETPDPATGSRVDIGDWFLESRLTFAGDSMRLRLGNHYYYADGHLIDEASRRGFSVRLTDPGGGYDASLFTLQPSQQVTTDNLTGLSDPSDRVTGLLASFAPVPGSGLRTSLTAYGGLAHDLPDGGAGEVSGAGLAFATPLGRSADFLLTWDKTTWDSGTGATTAQAFGAEANFTLRDGGDSSLGLTLGYDFIEEGYHSALNPDLIAGEETLTLALAHSAPEWNWELEAAYARTNAGAPVGTPEDHLGRLSFTASYAPQVFTGGFLNGSSFFFGAEVLTTDRIDSPPGSIAPSDNTIWSLSLGMDRFRPDHSFALLYTYDRFEDRTGAGLHEEVHGLEGLVSFTPSDRFNASFGADIEWHQTATGDFWQAEAQASLSYELIPDKLTYALEFGVEDYENPAIPDGAWLGTELAWDVFDSHALVVSADYGRGSKSYALAGGDGWVFGIALRQELALARYR